MSNISVFYIDYHVVFYIHSSTMVCLKFLWTDKVWILCFSDFHFAIRKIDFVAKPHPVCENILLGQGVWYTAPGHLSVVSTPPIPFTPKKGGGGSLKPRHCSN
ncbi:hypothetical protein Hanom_Chr11g00981231 [Helianthus anomalus]